MIRFEVSPPGAPPFTYEMTGSELVVGRSTSCDLAVSDDYLSRRHARFTLRDGRLLVEDLGSANGTAINGRRIDRPTAVAADDVVAISATTLRLIAPGDDPEEAPGEPDQLLNVTLLRPLRELLPERGGPQAEQGEGGELRRYADQLQVLVDLHRALSGPLELDGLLHRVLDAAFEHLRPEEASIVLRDGEGGWRVAASRAADPDGSPPLSRTLIREVVDKGQGAMILDSHHDHRLAGAESLLITAPRAILAVPLLDDRGGLGMLAVSARLQARLFGEQDLALLASVGSVAALRIRNLELLEVARDRQRLATELELARKLQTSLLPKELPELPGWEIFGVNVPSGFVSGDYYQVASRDEGRECVLTLADVCGKGMGAALLTASLEAVAAAATEAGLPLEAICRQANRFLYRRTPPDKYATAALAVLRADSAEIQLLNAGHLPPLLLRAGGAVERLEATGFPIGLVPDGDYETARWELAAGDLVVLLTDGITEAENPAGEELGEERLLDLLSANRQLPLAGIAAALQEAIDVFVADGTIADDRTLLLVRRTS